MPVFLYLCLKFAKFSYIDFVFFLKLLSFREAKLDIVVNRDNVNRENHGGILRDCLFKVGENFLRACR
jgi:hypothetical protein